MKTTFQFLCFFCFALLILSGCEVKVKTLDDQEKAPTNVTSSQIPVQQPVITLQPTKDQPKPEISALSREDQEKLDKAIEKFGVNYVLFMCVSEKAPNILEEYLLKHVKYLVSKGADVNYKHKLGSLEATPLIFACQNERLIIAEYLLSQGADININLHFDNDPEGTPPLIVAIRGMKIEAVKFFASHGADINAKYKRPDGSYISVLDVAKEHASHSTDRISTDIVEYLISIGAK